MTSAEPVVNWKSAVERLGSKDRVKLDRNTYLERRADDKIAVRYHETDVVTYTPLWIELDSGGWHTVSTMDRMRNHIPGDIRSDKYGWHWYPLAEVDCYCARTEDRGGSGIIVNGELRPGTELVWTETWQLPDGSQVTTLGDRAGSGDAKPVYVVTMCRYCHGTSHVIGIDWDSGGHPYYDGIRLRNDGRRLHSVQPAKPADWEPVYTRSGFSGGRIGFAASRRR